jgi:hypothetical protein
MVSALRVGTATITATGKRDGSQTATATVTVASLPVFTYRLPVTIDNTANATSALSYYQVGISLTGAAYTSINTHAKADRSDLRVTDSDGVTPLSFALEGNDTANSAVYLLVKVPYVAAGGTRTIYVYYGNAAAASVSSYATTVGPTTAITGPTDVFTQTDDSPFNANEVAILLKNQGGIHGGGAGLNGKILCWILAGAGSNADRSNGDIVMLSSTDGGVTFPTKTILVTHDATNTAEPRSVVELADGTIILAYSTDTNTNSSAGKAKMYLAKSVNGGVSWTNLGLFGTPINPLTVPWIYNTNVGSCYGRIIEKTPGGDLFLPVYGAITGDAKWHSWLLKCPSGSDPVNGATWVTQGTIAFDNTNQWSETTVIQTTSASNLLAIMRNDVVGDLYQCTSADSGATWTTPARINLPGITVVSFASAAISPELIRLASGNYLLCFGVRYGNDFGSCAAVLSTDGGATWIDRAPFCTTTGYTQALWDGGYPTAVQNADGTICVLGYRNLNNIAICNVFRMVFTEDYIANCNNVYEGCESLGGRWAAVGANATLDAAHVNHGTRAVKIDNSAATGGVNDYATYQAWDTDPAQTNPRVAVSYWSYQTANDSNDGFKTLDATDSVTTPGHARTTAAVLGTASQHLEWYNGTAYQDTGVAVPLNQWAKKTLRANMGPSSLTGQLLVNNVSATSSLGQSFSGAAPVYLHWLGASLGTTHNVIYWIDDLYTHQYAASIPAVTVGAEQSGLSTTASAAITLAPDTVSASAVAPPSRTASAAITLAPDTVAAAAVAAAPGGATATGSFTLRADTVTCTVGPYYTVTPSTAHADPYHATTVS